MVLHGLPTTSTFAVLLALSLMYFPVSMNMLALSFNRSPRSIPGPLGLAPTKRAKSISLNPFYLILRLFIPLISLQ